jgi:hypothetical protein
MVTVENRFGINSATFKDILNSERECLTWLNSSLCIGYKRDIAYDTLKKIRARKEAYERTCCSKRQSCCQP